ncbi:MAG: flagellar basal body L-ring protein FlgH [Burkholderiales bacterium]|nr:flagellar basal body L-ring protein FlgH [Burkholderiales bacterium]
MLTTFTAFTGAFLALALQGCAFLGPRVEVAETAPPMPEPPPPASAAGGSIFKATNYRPLFEDHRARLVGDTLVVQIVEKVTAVQKSTSSIDKSGSVSAGISALPGIAPNSFGRAGAEANSSNSFAGKGAVENSNDFSGTITVVVRQVLPNGHLLISGEKQIGVNQNVDVLRFSGQVDPRAILPGNQVQSAQIANVRLEQRGRGAQAEAQAIGWLGRVFLSLLPF